MACFKVGKRKERGFTIIELVVALVVIGIFSTGGAK